MAVAPPLAGRGFSGGKMKVITVKFYLCNQHHKHTSKAKCLACNKREKERIIRLDKRLADQKVKDLLLWERMESAYYLNKRGKTLQEIATALEIPYSRARDILWKAQRFYAYGARFEWNLENCIDYILDYQPKWIVKASKLIARKNA